VIIYCSAFSLLVRLYIANRLQKKRIEEEAKHLKTLNNAVSDTSVNKGDLNG